MRPAGCKRVSNDHDSAPANNLASVTVNVAAADLVMSVGMTSGTAGGYPVYVATVHNNGPSTATNVVFTDTVSRYVIESATPSQGTCLAPANGVVRCNLGSLAAGASATITIAVDAPDRGWASNDCRVTADQPDPNPLNNAVRGGPGTRLTTQQ